MIAEGFRIGVDKATIHNWERNLVRPSLRTWPGVIKFLGYDPRPPAQTIGKKLRLHREGLGLSAKEAARIMGVDPSTLSKWELGTREPQGLYLQRVRRFLESLEGAGQEHHPE